MTIEGSPANRAELHDINAKREAVVVRQATHLSNIVEQDHRTITQLMLGFKTFSRTRIVSWRQMHLIAMGQMQRPDKAIHSL
ncbi:hypothetical protein D9M68_100560 [compost metagenome]